MSTKTNAPGDGGRSRGAQIIHFPCNRLAQRQPSRYAWRVSRGLETISDLIREYEASRIPKGSYATPMPDDLIHGSGH